MPNNPPSDPTALTTAQLGIAIASLKELMQSQLAAIDKAITIAHEDLVRVPTETQKAVGHLRELHDERLNAVDYKLREIHDRLEGKRISITTLLMDVARLQKENDGAHLQLNQVIQQAAVNATAVARLTSEAIAAREANVALYHSQQEAIAKAEAANEKRFQSVNEFRAQLGDQARTFMPRAEVEVMLKALDARLDKIENTLTERVGQKFGMREGWLAAIGVIGLIGTVLGILSLVRG